MKITSWKTLIDIYKQNDDWSMPAIHRDLLRTHPVYFARCISIKYHSKDDVYVGKFPTVEDGDGDDCTLKLTNDAAKFLLAHRMVDVQSGDQPMRLLPQVFLKLDDAGAVDDCVLVTICDSDGR
jgi:hypothetical protein